MFTFLVLQNVFRSKIIITICLKSFKLWKYWTNIAKSYSGWWYIEHFLSNVAGHLWEMLPSMSNQVMHRTHDRSKVSRKKFVTHSQWESAQATSLKKSWLAKLPLSIISQHFMSYVFWFIISSISSIRSSNFCILAICRLHCHQVNKLPTRYV